MRYLALACDYDGTLAHHGKVDEATLMGLERLLASGRKLLMVTGREIPDLEKTFPHFELFEWIVAENGALLYKPGSKETILLAEPPPDRFVEELKKRGVGPISTGGVIVATWEPHETIVLETIRDLGLELQVIFNKGAVMVLPSNVNKATGLLQAAKRMGLSPHNIVGVGDAENDHAFLSLCECSAAVENALPAVKQTADIVLSKDHGAGVVELIEDMVAHDLKNHASHLSRRDLVLGKRPDGIEERIPVFGTTALIAGPSGTGKSTVATSLLERMMQHKYQFCIIDPEGDYDGLEGVVVLGSAERGPVVDEVLKLLKKPSENVVVNMVGLPISDRPRFFLQLLPHLVELRASTGRPHWLIVDEAHHLLPTTWEPAATAMPQKLASLLLVTVHPSEVSPSLLKLVDLAIAVGADPHETLGELFTILGQPTPDHIDRQPEQVAVWSRHGDSPIRLVEPLPSHLEHRRHIRKYAEGVLPPDRSFFFRGPEKKLNLRAQNLMLFLQLADGIDDDTWTHHLRQGDYSDWFRVCIKDARLAEQTQEVEQNESLLPAESRKEIRKLVEARYTLPASSLIPMPGTDSAPRFGTDGAQAKKAAGEPKPVAPRSGA